jgi:superfamily II DNA or RNA helicase
MSFEIHILPEESLQTRRLVISCYLQGEKLSLYTLKSKRKLSDSLMQLIERHEVLYQKEQKGKRSVADREIFSLHVSARESVKVLKELILCGELLFKGKKLIPNFFSETQLKYVFEKKGEFSSLLTIFVKTSREEFLLGDCWVFPGAPCWFIKDGVIRVFSEELSYHFLKQESGILLSSKEHEDLKQDLEEWEEEGILVESLEEVSIKQKPTYPLLKLTDAYGVCAKLYLDDGDKIIEFSKELGSSWEEDLLESGYQKQYAQSTEYYCSADKTMETLQFLLELGWKIEDYQGRFVESMDSCDIHVSCSDSNLVLSGKASFGNETVSLKDIRDVVVGAGNGQLIALPSNKVGLFSFGKELAGIVDCDEGEEGELLLDKALFGSLSSVEGNGAIDWDFDPSASLLCDALSKKWDRVDYLKPLPPVVEGMLRDYQKEGISWLNFLYEQGFHGLLADDMGLGKTLQVLSFLHQVSDKQWHLVVLPSSLLFQWEKEANKYFPDINIWKYYGIDRVLPEDGEGGIVLTTYQLLQRDYEKLASKTFHCICLDEAQKIKNPRSKTFLAAKSLQGRFRLSITGTPIENHLTDLWSQMHFLMPKVFDKQIFQDISLGGASQEILDFVRRKVDPFVLRREKKEVAKELPELLHQDVWLEFSNEEQKCYDYLLSKKRGELLNKIKSQGFSKNRHEIFELILRLRQVCCHPVLATNSLPQEFLTPSLKMNTVVEDVVNLLDQGSKVIVFSQFTSVLNLLQKQIKESTQKILRLDGSTKDREGVVESFQNCEDSVVLLCSLKAGGIGLNLTAADYVILYEPWWNEAVEQQAIDRAHRLGRCGQVIAKRYLYAQTIEEKMHLLKKDKQRVFHHVFNEQSSWNDSDVEYLLS